MKNLPKQGIDASVLEKELNEMSVKDLDWKKAHFFGYIYYAHDKYYDIMKKAFMQFSNTNGLNPAVFPSLRKMENDILSISCGILNGGEGSCGTLTSGGTESIFMSVKMAITWAKENKPTATPEILIPKSAHPAFAKAAAIMQVRTVEAELDEEYKLDMADLKAKTNANTILIVGSAPSYPQGAIDPIEEIAAWAKSNNCLMHVDACVGGFYLPFLKMNGIDLPAFDFSVEGVTSMSADLHKYGYAMKGASVIMYKTEELRKYQFYVKTDWAGGVYGSPSFAGTRGGAPIAAAWTTLHTIGEDGYKEMALDCYNEAQMMIKRIKKEIPEVKVLGNPILSLFSVGSDSLDMYEVADEMGEFGWVLNRQQDPKSIHVLINNVHVGIGNKFVDDLKISVAKTKKVSLGKLKNAFQLKAIKGLKKMLNEDQMTNLTKQFSGDDSIDDKRKAAMYGMMAELSGTGTLDELVLDYLNNIFDKEGE